jgi:hypothetical protein
MEEKKIIESFNFNSVSIPSPIERVSRTKNWVEWGDNNLYPYYLIDLSNKSSLHSSIVKQKAMLIGGGGWNKQDLSPEGIQFLKNIYNQDDCDEILFKISMDLELYGGFYLNLIWSKDGSKISEINYIDPSKVRIANPYMKDDGIFTEQYFISQGWENLQKYPPVLYQGFSTMDKSQKSQILYVKEYRPGTEFYARPEYEAGVRWIELEWEVSNFHLNNVKNGFHPSVHINFPIGQPSQEEASEIIKRLKNQYQGSDMAGNVLITFSQDKDSAATFDRIELNTSDERFIMLNKQIQEGILKAHRVINPALFGIETPGALGSRNELLESLEIFQTQYTKPKQRLIEKTFNWLRRINGIDGEFKISVYSPQFSKINTNMGDVLQILESQIPAKQKYYLLIQNEYDESVAKNLTEYDPELDTNEIKANNLSPIEEDDNEDEKMIVNENVKNLTAKQHQQLLRIIRQYKKNQLSKEQASILIKSGLGLLDAEVDALLGDITQNN